MWHCANFEDRTIFELLGEPQYPVFWIDCGAHSPFMESVTRFFYERGGNGINLEPLQRYYRELVAHRPRDVNLNLACGESEGIITLYDGDGLTTANKDFAHTDWPSFEIPMVTLRSVCHKYVTIPVDFLKIDVETHERAVILGADWGNYRPRVLAIEAKAPMDENVETHREWEPVLLEANYIFVSKDRFNRYYMSREFHYLRGLAA